MGMILCQNNVFFESGSDNRLKLCYEQHNLLKYLEIYTACKFNKKLILDV